MLNRRKKIIRITGGALLALALLIVIFYPYVRKYQMAKNHNTELNNRIDEAYRELVNLYAVQQEYRAVQAAVADIYDDLYADQSYVLDVVTTDSPIRKFEQALLQKGISAEGQAGTIEYPFELAFSCTFEQLGRYLVYQENALPPSTIRTIDIRPEKKIGDRLQVRIAGTIYTIEKP